MPAYKDVEQAIRAAAVRYPLLQVAQRGRWWYVTVWIDHQERTETATELLTALNRLMGHW